MTLSKCKWFNDHQAPCCLMIDDLVPAAVSLDGTLGPHNDWGYLMNRPDSLFDYFKRNLLENFPEIRGTFFVPLEAQRSIPEGPGYAVFKKDIDKEYVEFMKSFSDTFELAFHGIRHTYMFNNTRYFEFEKASREDFAALKKKITVYALMGIEFAGGKFPGYRFNETAIDFIKFMNYKWFALDAGMINRKHPGNGLSYVKNSHIVIIPTNVSGDIFNKKPNRTGFLKRAIKHVLYPGRYMNPEAYLEYLYVHGYPVTIQEHFQNQAPNGKRQTPNVYDDINSLECIFGFMRPWDIWHASCSEIACYFDSYVNTTIIRNSNGDYEIRRDENWEGMALSFAAECPCLEETHGGGKFIGIARNKRFVFNGLPEGTYRPCR